MLQYKIARVLVEELADAFQRWDVHNSENKGVRLEVLPPEAILDLDGHSNNAKGARLSDEYPGMTILTRYVFDINKDVDLIGLRINLYPNEGERYHCILGITDGVHYVDFRDSETKYPEWKKALAAMAQLLRDHLVKDFGWEANPDSDGGYSDLKYYLP